MGARFDLQSAGKSLKHSLLATVFVLPVMVAAYFWDPELLPTSIGASAFIAFTFPFAQSSRPRFLVGGYACAVFWGIVFCLCRQAWGAGMGEWSFIVFCLAGLFCASLSMDLLNFEHPPSAALAIGIVLADRPFAMAVLALGSIVLLCFFRRLVFPPSGASGKEE